jgi:hypothetical protein
MLGFLYSAKNRSISSTILNFHASYELYMGLNLSLEVNLCVSFSYQTKQQLTTEYFILVRSPAERQLK